MSEENLYREVFKTAQLMASDNVLEVGSGLGLGCILGISEYKVRSMVGLDLSSDQLHRAHKLHSALSKDVNNLQFLHGDATRMPLQKSVFSKVISVETAQHFKDVPAFLSEAHRVLKPNGRLVITTFFATSHSSLDELAELIPTIKEKVDNVIPVSEVTEKLKDLCFKNIECTNIGEHVWYGLDKWIAQTVMKDTWDVNWLKAYKRKLVDYYIISADKNLI